jgi:GNAT superfamily N-acetyltransferase
LTYSLRQGIPDLHLSPMHSYQGVIRQADNSDPERTVPNEELLDNPIWNSLQTGHESLAIGHDYARRYPPAIGPLAGTPDQSPESYRALRPLAGPGGIVALFFPDPPVLPAGWMLFRGGLLTQMVCRHPKLIDASALRDGSILRRLDPANVPAMVDLATLTEPGPFRERTIELGSYFGVMEGERLLAMAGQRMRVPGFVEVSAVCTHPEARGRGHAGILMSRVMQAILQEGATPFLHAFADNPAVSLYSKLGFVRRRAFHLAVIKRED